MEKIPWWYDLCAVILGEDHVKNRIRHVLDYRKPPFWILIGAVAVIAALIICLCSNPGGNRSEEKLPTEAAPSAQNEPVDISDTEYSDEAVWTQEEWDIYAEKLSYVTFETRSDFAEFYSPERIESTHSFAQEKGWYVNHRRYAGSPASWEMFQLSRLEERLGSEDHRFYEDYKDPVTAAKQLLSLGKGTGEVTEVLYEAARQYQLYGDDRMGEGSVVNVGVYF